jgi:predicted metal-dependent enzyme (double-stranded beta helix superfamily)
MTASADVFHLDSAVLRSFVDDVQRIVEAEPDRSRTVQLLREPFSALLRDETWLPDQFRVPDTTGGMGGGIGNYLLYRSAARDLTLMSLVVPPGAGTPVHDHLAWGLVGLYGGEQDEWVYSRLDSGDQEGHADLVEVERRRLHTGDFYELLPPHGDIHRVVTVSETPSISLHLLGSDIGCTWRHPYEVEHHAVHSFRSSYSNEPCEDERA